LGLAAQGMVDHPQVDLADEAEALGDVEEGGRRDEAAFPVGEPQQHLVVADAPLRPQPVDRLEMEHESVLGERPAQAGLPVQPPVHADELRVLGIKDLPAVAAALLGRVHGHVGARQEVAGALPVAGEDDDADAGAHAGGAFLLLLAQGRQQVLGHAHRIAHPGLRQDDAELVSAEAPEHVAAPQRLGQAAGGGQQEAVAGLVAEGVVDVLELVEVHVEQGAFVAVAAGQRHVPLELLLEAAPVEQAGEGVVIGEEGEPLLGALALGDVEPQAPEQVASLGVALGGDDVAHPDAAPVRAQHAVVQGGHAAEGRQAPQALAHPARVLRMDVAVHEVRRQPCLGVHPEQAAHVAADVAHAQGVGIGLPQHRPDALQHRRPARRGGRRRRRRPRGRPRSRRPAAAAAVAGGPGSPWAGRRGRAPPRRRGRACPAAG